MTADWLALAYWDTAVILAADLPMLTGPLARRSVQYSLGYVVRYTGCCKGCCTVLHRDYRTDCCRDDIPRYLSSHRNHADAAVRVRSAATSRTRPQSSPTILRRAALRRSRNIRRCRGTTNPSLLRLVARTKSYRCDRLVTGAMRTHTARHRIRQAAQRRP